MARSRRKSRTPSDRGAFTLVELLVVIVVLGLLVALLFPSLRGVWDRYHMTRCQTNLAHIYQAFRLRASDEAMGAKESYAVEAWSGVLLPYLENDASQLVCIETSQGDAIPSRPITELVEFRSVAGGRICYTQMEPGPWMLKLSDTQWNKARGMGLLSNDRISVNIDTKYPEFAAYVPDGTPDVYWLCLEDPPVPDRDFKDVMTKVTFNPDHTVTLECISGDQGSTNHLMDKTTGEEIFHIPKNTSVPKTVTLYVGGSGAWASSYAMNEYAVDKVDAFGKPIRRSVGGAGGKILVLDYPFLVAKSTDLWTDEFFDPDQKGEPRFARHFGMANVLFSDGSVHPERPEDIDPIGATVAKKWWMP